MQTISTTAKATKKRPNDSDRPTRPEAYTTVSMVGMVDWLAD